MRRYLGTNFANQIKFYRAIGVSNELAFAIAAVFNFVYYSPRYHQKEDGANRSGKVKKGRHSSFGNLP